MAGDEWVVDTNILGIASAGNNPLSLAAVSLLHSILERHCLAVDPERQIIAEYTRYLSDWKHAAEWWRQLTLRRKLVFHSNKLTQTKKRALERLKFDTTDWKFLGVALRTPAHLLVAEESDYWEPAVASYIQNDLGISLLRVQDAVKRV